MYAVYIKTKSVSGWHNVGRLATSKSKKKAHKIGTDRVKRSNRPMKFRVRKVKHRYA